ncbi:hypothetical protein [Pseudanabaena galeata]|nr:hypothetical protein [Pseudanabaena galeata]
MFYKSDRHFTPSTNDRPLIPQTSDRNSSQIKKRSPIFSDTLNVHNIYS